MRILFGPVAAGLLILAPIGASSQPAMPPAWAHEASDLKSDPAVHYGVLPNGMRYAILRNATPPGEASLRLRIDAGSLHERDDQRGLAHFLEHMVLNGTKNVPEGEFVKRLERLGLRFGPDTNASTGFDQTVFQLDLPKADDTLVNEGLFLLREVADEATLDAKSIDGERGIILSEERSRASPSYRVGLDTTRFLFKDQLLGQRFPIGEPDIIRTAPAQRFVDYYRAYYRPERAMLIAVGDFDVAAMEAKIRTRFSNWKAQGPAGPEPALGPVPTRGREARVFAERGLPASIALTWVRPYRDRPDTAANRRDRFVEALGFAVLNRRFARMANGDKAPFVTASGGSGDQGESASATGVFALAAPGKWRDALAAIDQEQRRLVAYGVAQAELDRELTEAREGLRSGVAAATTRHSRALAAQLVGTLGEDKVFTTPAEQLARFESWVKEITPAKIRAAMPPLFSGQGPFVVMTSATPVAEGEAGLLAAYAQSNKTEVAAFVAPVTKTFPYTSFGTPGAVVERSEVGGGTGATAVRFANGTRLTVKQTNFRKDQILVSVDFGNGQLDLSPRDTSPGPLNAAVVEGGLGKLTYEELKQALAPNLYGIAFGMGTENYGLSGSTRPADFALQMQLLAAYLTDPAWRPTGWERARTMGDTVHDMMESTPGGVFGRDAGELLRSGDRRWHTKTREEIARSRIEDARAFLQKPLATGPLEVVIVGDITVDEAIRQTAATLGALPPRPPAPPPGQRDLRFPAPTPTPVMRTHKGRADQAMAFIAWPTEDYYSDRKRARTFDVLADIVQLRLTEEIREKQGATYSPSAGSTSSSTWTGYGYISASLQAPPDKLAGFFADAQRIVAELAAKPPTADELDRARKPTIASIKRGRASSNGWWMGAIDDVQTDPRVLENLATHLPDIEAVTPADVQRLAAKYLRADKAWKMIVVPEAKPVVTFRNSQGDANGKR